MAIKTVSIGTAKDIYRFDDGDTEYGIETDAKIKVGTAPTVNDEVVRYQDIPTPGDAVSASANITDNAIVRGDGGAKGVQDSLPTIDDAGNISFPGVQTVDGVDISAHAGNVAAHHAKYTDAEARSAINNIFGADGKADTDVDMDTHNITNPGTVDGRDVSVDGAKLDGIEAGAEVNHTECFLASCGAQANITGDGTNYTVPFVELVDPDNVFAAYTHTAGEDGLYNYKVILYLTDVDKAAFTNAYCRIVTTKRTYFVRLEIEGIAGVSGTGSMWCSIDANMDSGDTAYVTFQVDGPSKFIDLAASSYFSGFLAISL